MSEPVTSPWWRSAVIYQVYPRSFADSDGDGVGDLEGVRRHLDHLAWLGIDAIWLSPFYRSPMADFGYDVADFREVDPLFGDLAAFDRLVGDAHALGIRVLVDLVPNHTSDQHPWFVASRSSREDPKRSWYVWRDGGGPAVPPNNWRGAFIDGGRAWTWDDTTAQWYLHQFLPQQPDLNWDNPEVVDAMHDVMRFWLDRGADGFRIDVVHCIGRDPAFPDDEPPWSEVPHCASNEHPSTHEHVRAMRRLADGYEGDRVLIGETALPVAGVMFYFQTPYYGRDELYLDATERAKVIDRLLACIREGLPVLNSRAGLLALRSGKWARRTPAAVVADVDGESVCCRAPDECCEDCGYAACTEIVEAFRLRPSAVLAMGRYW